MDSLFIYPIYLYRNALVKTLFKFILIAGLLLSIVGILAEGEINIGVFKFTVGFTVCLMFMLLIYAIRIHAFDKFRFSESGVLVHTLSNKKHIAWIQITDISYRKMPFRGVLRDKIVIAYKDDNKSGILAIEREYDSSHELVTFIDDNIIKKYSSQSLIDSGSLTKALKTVVKYNIELNSKF